MEVELIKLIVSPIFQILRLHDVRKILYWTYEFRFEVRVSNVTCMLNSTHNVECRLRYRNVTQEELVIFRPSAETKAAIRNEPVGVFQFCSVMRTLEIAL